MPKLTPGAKTRDMTQTAAQLRGGTPWGRVRAAIGFAIAGVDADTWMSPNQPVAPVAQEAFGRNKDYQVGYNLMYTPRGGELTGFATLRALADNCDLVRLAIETRKDQVKALKWSIAHVDPTKDKTTDPRAKKIEAMFKSPDGIWPWAEWIGMLLEDMFVIDAATILPRRLNSGAMYGFEVIDGATIKPLIDAQGRRPLPPSPAFQQNLKGLPAVDYTADELIYRPRNPRSNKFYGFSQVEQIQLTVNIALRRNLSQLQYFTEGNIPAAFINVPDTWTPQQIEQFQGYWDTVIEGDQAQKRKVRFVPAGTNPKPLLEAPLKDEFDEWLARVVCYAFSLPPTAFVKQMNRSTSETQQDTALSEGLTPIMEWVKSIMDHLIQVQLGAPDLQLKWVEEEENDPVQQMTVLTGYQKTGIFSINEIRAKLGEDPISEEGGDEYLIITATGAIPLEQALEPPPPPPTMTELPGATGNDDPNNPKPPGGKKTAPKAEKTNKAEKVAHGHLHKADTSELAAPMVTLRDSFAAALETVRDEAVKKAQRVEKAAANTDDRGNGYARDAEDLPFWDSFADTLDTSGLSLAWDDYSDTLQAVSADGARQEVARIVQADSTVEPAARGAGFDFLDHQDPAAIDWANTHAAEMLTSDGGGGALADSTRDMVRKLIANALEEKVSDAEIARRLQDAYAFSPQRAELIARTEVGNALGAGGLAGAKAVGMQSKRWLLSNDEGICPSCEANAKQQWIAIDKPYVSGALAPLQHPHCRCDQAYRRQSAED